MLRGPEVEAAVDEIEKHGAALVEISQGRKHVRVYFAWQGVVRFVVCPLTGSDWRGPLNARQSVRRQLGIERKAKKIGRRRIRKNTTDHKHIEAPNHITVGRDPFKTIYGTSLHRAALCVAADRAWARWFGEHLRSVGYQPVNPAMRAS